MTQLLAATQVTEMVGPETPGCACPGCEAILKMKALVCEMVTQHDPLTAAMLADPNADEDNLPPAAWLTLMVVAAARCRAQGMDLDTMRSAVLHGVGQTEAFNPLMCADDGKVAIIVAAYTPH